MLSVWNHCIVPWIHKKYIDNKYHNLSARSLERVDCYASNYVRTYLSWKQDFTVAVCRPDSLALIVLEINVFTFRKINHSLLLLGPDIGDRFLLLIFKESITDSEGFKVALLQDINR